jgi:predicted O-linked N-acetylglucosamine transferase (SPINDLY family)
LLRHHERASFTVYCYYNHEACDEITRRFMGLSDHWRGIAGADDDTVAKLIVDDEIDILVDLAGHTTGNRLGVFARKPSPVQVSWLGYLCTTGLDTIDHRLCDIHTDPPGSSERHQVEKPARMPHSQWCYQPQVALPVPSSLPRLVNGYWTFGSFNQASKLNTMLLECWANLLCAVPDSRLRIMGIADDELQRKILDIFSAHEVTADRLDLIGRVPIESYFLNYHDVDIALDTFPYNGATTTCDALIMGVPVATVAGDRAIARGGVSILSTVGMHDWIAPSSSGLVDMLQQHLGDPTKLSILRQGLPEKMRASALMDGPTSKPSFVLSGCNDAMNE